MNVSSRRTWAVLATSVAVVGLAACGTSSTGAAPATTASSSASGTGAQAVPVPTATASAAPAVDPGSAGLTRVSSSQGGVFSVDMPAGWKQNPDPYTVPSITLDDPAGGNLQITSLRDATPPRTVTEEFSRQRDAIVAAFPGCNFPAGADVIGEKLGGTSDANYRVLTCPTMPFAFTVFTANGPNGEMIAGHDADFGGKADRWKDVVRSVVTTKR